MIVPPTPASGPRRVAGLTWAATFAAIGGGLFVGALVSGYFELTVEEVSTLIEVIVAIPTLVLGAFALAWRMSRRVRLSAAVRYGLVVCCLVSGFLVGSTLPSEEGTRDDVRWLRSGEGRVSLALLGFSLLSATVISFRRFPPSSMPDPVDNLQEAIRY
jgi:hypothetical protein